MSFSKFVGTLLCIVALGLFLLIRLWRKRQAAAFLEEFKRAAEYDDPRAQARRIATAERRKGVAEIRQAMVDAVKATTGGRPPLDAPSHIATHGKSPTQGIPRKAATRLLRADLHYQLRILVEDFPGMRSPDYLDWAEDFWANENHRPEFKTYMLYKIRWIRNCYPRPSRELCESFYRKGNELSFVSIESGLDFRMPKEYRHKWACEATGAFLQADTLEAMRLVGMNYPILLRPAVQGGIDSQIERLPEPKRTLLFKKFALLQQLREEVEGHPIKSWWRPGGDPDPITGRPQTD